MNILDEYAEFLRALTAIDILLIDYEQQQGWVDTIELLQRLQDLIPQTIKDSRKELSHA